MPRPVCANCGKIASTKVCTRHESYHMKPTGEITVSKYGRSETVMERVDTPYRGNKKIIRQLGPTQYLWDGESYELSYDEFCTKKCALEFAMAAHRAGFRRRR